MANDSPIQFKGTQLKIIHTHLRSTDTAVLQAALTELIADSPDFFENELAILDFSTAEILPVPVDWPQMRKLLAQAGLHAIATCGLPEQLALAAAQAGLPTVGADSFSRPQKLRGEEAPIAAPVPAILIPEVPVAPRTLILDKPLRSGQRYYARGGDLIVTAMVSAGAEVIADGNIHVYAPLRGRALAGASGDHAARIFTTSLEAELVSIAGIYRTFEAGVPAELARQPATISLTGEGSAARLHVAPLSLR